MTRPSKRPGRKTTLARRPSRAVVDKTVSDLCDRLYDEMKVAEAIEKAARPHGETIMCSFPMLKVVELAAGVHARALRQMWESAISISAKMARVRSEIVP